MTKVLNEKVPHTLQTYNVLRWQNIVARWKKKQSLAAARSSSKKYECVRCLKHFVHRSRLARHKATFHDDGVGTAPPKKVNFFAAVIKCIHCGAVFLNADQYANHSVLFHSELLASAHLMGGNDRLDDMLCSLRSTVIVASAYMCEFCDKRFSDLPTLFHHESLHDPAQGFGCKFSQRNFKTLEDVAAYRTSKREYDEKIPNVPNVYCCNMCMNGFDTLHALYNHRYEMNHFFPRPTEKQPKAPGLIEHCAICGYLSNSATELVAHHNENHIKTTKTMNETAHSARLTSVINQKEGSKQLRPYLCEKCGKTYTQSSHLFQHLRFHNGVRPFTCPHTPCQRTFTIRPDLNDHVRKCHTGERPFKCEVCGKRFLTGSVYYQHRLIHRGERRYACSDCDKCFYRADALKNHQRIHTGEKPYGCDVCGRKFRQRGDREKHVRVKHMKMR